MRRSKPALVVISIWLGACGGDAPTTPPIDDDPVVPDTTLPNPIPTERVGVSGVVHVLEGDLPVGLVARAWTGIDSVTSPVDASARFSLAVPRGALDSTEIAVGQALDGSDEVFPALLVIDRLDADVELTVLLIPRSWTIDAGRYAGRTIPMSLQRALAPENAVAENGDGNFFWLWPSSADGTLTPPSLSTVSWPDFPVPVYLEPPGTSFDGRESLGIAGGDSVGFWGLAERLEESVGIDLFEPVPYDELPVDTLLGSPARLGAIGVRRGARGLGNYAQFDAGCTGWIPPEERAACDRVPPGAAAWARITVIHPWAQYEVQHELIHALGFGHSCWTPTLMGHCVGPFEWEHLGHTGEDPYIFEATPYDVAHMQIYFAIHRRSMALEPDLGLVEALDGERRLLGGRGPIPAAWIDRYSPPPRPPGG